MDSEEYRIISYLRKRLNKEIKIFFRPFLNGEKPDIVLVKENSGVIIIGLSNLNLDGAKAFDKRTIVLKNGEMKLNPIVKIREFKDNFFGFHMEKLLKAKIYKRGIYSVIKSFIYFKECEKENYEILNDKLYTFSLRAK